MQGGIFAPDEARAAFELEQAPGGHGKEPRVQQQVVPLSAAAAIPAAPASPAAPVRSCRADGTRKPRTRTPISEARMTTPEPSSAPAMPALSPIDVIAEEAGAILGRVEREARLQGTALAADMRALTSDLQRREVELDLRMARLEQAAAERLAGLKDGRDGELAARGQKAPPGLQGPPGEAIQGPPGVIPEPPPETVERIERALALLAQPIAVTAEPSPVVVNIGERSQAQDNHHAARR